MDNHPTESLNEETSQPVNDGTELDNLLSLRGKPFANWKEERLYLREKWGMQGRKVEPGDTTPTSGKEEEGEV